MRGPQIWVTARIAFSLLILQAVRLVPLHAQSAPTGSDAAPLLQSLLIAHHAWLSPPASIRIRGTSVRGTTRRPVMITATQKEETVTSYGSTRRVATPSSKFQDDGQKSSFDTVPPAFDQLDVTGMFLISQMTRRLETAGTPETYRTKDGWFTRVHLSSGRTQTHFRQLSVKDELDVLISPSGLLAGIERSFYPANPRLHYTAGYRFTEYRDAGGVLLPYRIDSIFKGNIEETILVDDYQFNVAAIPSLFESRSQSGSKK